MIIERQSLLFYKAGNIFSSEHETMRYRIYKSTENDVDMLMVAIWKGPWCFSKTSDDLKQYNKFDLSDDGIDSAIKWIQHIYEEEYSKNDIPSSIF